MAEQTVNIPQTLVFVILFILALRWYFSRPTPGATPPTGTRGVAPTLNRGVRINPVQVETVAQMFPDANRRSIMWDLQRNGGNVTATVERLVEGRGLDTPPQSFQPPTLRTSNPTSRTAAPLPKPAHPDLITRYNLSSKIGTEPSSSLPQSDVPKKAWSADKNERQQMLQRRRDDMILAARRKLEEKEKAINSEVGS
ncbi:putative AMFR protein [Lophium mytilinum]|uniref:Coupling of ubiquitin conjugation to ER degradation protein 1 n=1 Tax=Lophium mytilinum TaxID=390894 RepID=A0A6A6QB63_9PEZI|nr:putative AMFR protein [Lophium mytilinum]